MRAVTVVIPVYQNRESLTQLVSGLQLAAAQCRDTAVDLLFVNDGSSDGSLELLRQLRNEHANIAVIDLIKNFGQVAAIHAGLTHARGDAVVVMSADLQDPPELLSRFVERWQAGSKFVVGTREHREDAIAARVTSRFFYWMMRKALPAMPARGFDCFLLDRAVLSLYLESEERNSFLQGRLLWLGLKPDHVSYTRQARPFGRSQWSVMRKIGYFLDGLIAYSVFPIRIVTITGFIVFALSIVAAVAVILQRIFIGTKLPGWSSLILAVIALGGLQMLLLGILGEYMWRNLEESRKRPIYLVRDTFPSRSVNPNG